MKRIILFLTLMLLFSCDKEKKQVEKFTFWETFTTTDDTNFLLNHSKDTIKCSECNVENELITKQAFFKNDFRGIISKLKGEEYYTHKEKRNNEYIYRVSYTLGEKKIIDKIFNNKAEGVTTLIFMLTEKDRKIIFEGVISVP
ncbi:hypothetical protein UJ101_02001 [Flavobacteriaceae bacterium UJ101]|nr:hypothetical protein UJ101_02001 [Flavobacteriaceae bacterium UJ101]